MGQFIDTGIETVVDWCCHEIEVNGAAVVGGDNSKLVAGVAGLYRFSVTLPFTTYGSGLAEVQDPDDTVQLNSTAVAVPWNSSGSMSNPDFESFTWATGDTALVSQYYGDAVIQATLAMEGGAAGDSVVVWFEINGNPVSARAVVTFDAAGSGSATLVYVGNVNVGETIEVWCEDHSGAPSGTVVANATYSNMSARRLVGPYSYARVDAFAGDGSYSTSPVAPASYSHTHDYSGTFVLTGIVPLEAEGYLQTRFYTEHPGGISLHDYSHGELNWLGPLAEWDPCNNGGGE